MITESLNCLAKAKINLTLDILGKRPDGFHEVAMVMQAIDLADKIRLTITATPGITITGDVEGVAKPEDNLVYKAAQLFAAKYKLNLKLNIHLEKRIPVAAGLAGGSADAGAVLLGLNKLLGINDTLENLLELGAQLGSDIPFTMVGGTMLATGRGEILTPLKSNFSSYVVLVKPPVGISTPWAYQQYTKYKDQLIHPDLPAMEKALLTGELTLVQKACVNVFEQIMVQEVPEVRLVEEKIRRLGYFAMMSGSGPTVFSLVNTATEAEALAGKLKASFPTYTVIATKLA